MRSRRMLASAFLVGSLFLLQVAAQPKENEIVPGESVAGVRLGAHFSSFEKVFPKHPGTDTDYPDNGCGERVYQWVDIDRNASGVFVYLREGKINQLSVQTPRFALPNGMTLETTEEKVKQTFPKGHGHVLLGSGSKVVGGRDLVYWVDKEAGIALELYWNQQKRKRLVRGIDIFPKGADYRPEGCISPPQQWKELKQSTGARSTSGKMGTGRVAHPFSVNC